MEHPTENEALRSLAENFWDNDENWKTMADLIHNTNQPEIIRPENEDLYLAAVGLGKIEPFLTDFYEVMEEAGHIKCFSVCKDCYDFCTFEDYATIAEIYEYHYGTEEGEKIYRKIKEKFGKIVDDFGFFYGEVPELMDTFSKNSCEMCGSHLHGERFFVIFWNNRENINEHQESVEP